MSTDFHFKKSAGEFRFVADDDHEIYVCDELAFGFDLETGTLHKHGDRESVEAWAETSRKVFREHNLKGMADALVVVSSRDWDEETVNKFVSIPGNIKRWWERQQEVPVNEDAPEIGTQPR